MNRAVPRHTEYGVIHTKDVWRTYQELNQRKLISILKVDKSDLEDAESWRERRYQDQWVICSSDIDLSGCESIDAYVYLAFDQDVSQWSINLLGSEPLHLIYAHRNWSQRPWDTGYFAKRVSLSHGLSQQHQLRLEHAFNLPYPQLQPNLCVGQGIDFLALVGIPFLPYYDQVSNICSAEFETSCVLWSDWEKRQNSKQISA